MNGYEPDKEKAEDIQGEDLIASQIHQGIWEADGEASCTFDLQLKAASKSRPRSVVFDDSIDLDKVA